MASSAFRPTTIFAILSASFRMSRCHRSSASASTSLFSRSFCHSCCHCSSATWPICWISSIRPAFCNSSCAMSARSADARLLPSTISAPTPARSSTSCPLCSSRAATSPWSRSRVCCSSITLLCSSLPRTRPASFSSAPSSSSHLWGEHARPAVCFASSPRRR